MYIRMRSSGEILESNGLQKNAFIFDILANGIVGDINFKPTKTLFRDSRLYFSQPYVACNKKLEYIALPACCKGEVYLFHDKQKDEICLSDDLISLAGRTKFLTLDPEACAYFNKKGYFPAGRTYFIEIQRLLPRKIYYIQDRFPFDISEIKSDGMMVQANEKECYHQFQKALNSVILHEGQGNKNGVMLSGGADSRLLALLIDSLNLSVKTYTIRPIPDFKESFSDVSIAHDFTAAVGIEHKTIDVDFNQVNINDLDEIIKLMPLSPHLSLNFIAVTKRMLADHVTKAWCGQNLDNLYNYGPTSRFSFSKYGLMDIFKRYFLCEGHLSSYPDVIGGNMLTRPIHRLGGVAGANIYGAFKKGKYMPPKTCEDLFRNLSISYDNTIFTPISAEAGEKTWTASKTPREVQSEIFNNKVSGYLSGGASEAVFASSFLQSIPVVLPYSTENMINVFGMLRKTYKDVLYPKRYIYKYINELSKIYGKEITCFKQKKMKSNDLKILPNPHAWANIILTKTDFGVSLKEYSKIKYFPDDYTGIQTLQACLNAYWKNKFFENLQKEGVSIRKK